MTRKVAQILGGALLIALVAAGTPLAQTLRVARTIATAETKAESRLLLPGEWSNSASPTATKSDSGKDAPAAPKLVKPVSEQWDTAKPLQAPVAELPDAPTLPLCVARTSNSEFTFSTWLPQTDPPDIRLRGPPSIS